LSGFEDVLKIDVMGAYVLSREALSRFSRNKEGTLVFGNTPACKGHVSPFVSTGKFALHGLAQSLGREYGPKGIHVIHALIDFGIEKKLLDTEFSPADLTAHYLRFYDSAAVIDPLKVADSIYYLHNQDRSCWTNEIEFRPATGLW